MKTPNLLNFILAVALVILSCKVAFLDKKEDSGNVDASQAAIDNIMTRTSIRAYKDTPVEKEKVDTLLKAGMAAPTAKNKQPWHFIVVTDKATLKTISEVTPNAKMAADAPLAIVVCGDMSKAMEGEGRALWAQDASAATENILLAAHAMGLGAVWTGTFPYKDRTAAITKLFSLPEGIIPFCTIVLGYPDESPKPKDKWKPENVSYESYGNKGE